MSKLKLKFNVEFLVDTDTGNYPDGISSSESIAKYEEKNADLQALLDSALEDKKKSKIKIKVTPVTSPNTFDPFSQEGK